MIGTVNFLKLQQKTKSNTSEQKTEKKSKCCKTENIEEVTIGNEGIRKDFAFYQTPDGFQLDNEADIDRILTKFSVPSYSYPDSRPLTIFITKVPMFLSAYDYYDSPDIIFTASAESFRPSHLV